MHVYVQLLLSSSITETDKDFLVMRKDWELQCLEPDQGFGVPKCSFTLG